MSTLVEVLSPGYSRQFIDPDGAGLKRVEATGTCTLVRDSASGIKVLVDTMGPWDQQKLIQLLNSKVLEPKDIDYVVGTHGHPDHVGNLNLFTACDKHILGFSVYHKDQYVMHPFEEGTPLILSPNIQVIPTPGHTMSCVSLLVTQAGDLGTIVVAGDLFENEQDLTDDEIWKDAGSEDSELQMKNRIKVLSLADYIIPGHGDMFRVPLKFKPSHGDS